MRIWLIAARDRNNGIAKNGAIPWKCPEDMKHFSSVTRGTGKNAVLMGRRTWETIGKPLPGRLNLVMTRQVAETDEVPDLGEEEEKDDRDTDNGVCFVPTLNDALQVCAEKNIENLWICGGGQIYEQVLNEHSKLVEVCVLTTVDDSYDCDLFFPELCGKTWEHKTTFPLGNDHTTVDIFTNTTSDFYSK